MKKLRLLVILSIIACSFLALIACKTPELPKPTSVKVDEAVNTVSWDSVQGASGYRVRITSDYTEDKEIDIKKNYYDISELDSGHGRGLDYIEYVISVKALGDKVNYSDSPWAEITVKKTYENGMVYQLINGSSEYEVVDMGSASGDVEVPEEYRGKKVTSVGASAFYGNAKLISIKLPDTITSIGNKAFHNCSNLERINLPENLTYLGTSAFQNCRKLKEIEIPDSITSINNKTFSHCHALTKVTIGNDVDYIGKEAFLYNIGLKNLVIPDGVKVIDESAFGDCAALESVKFGKGLLQLEASSFRNCPSLTEIDFGEQSQLSDIGDAVFRDDIKLDNVKIPDSVLRLGNQAFMNCKALDDIHLGASVTTIETNCFYNTALWDASEEDIVYVDNWIVGCKDYETESVNIKPGTIGICSFAFYVEPVYIDDELVLCSRFTKLTIPDSVKYIGMAAFAYCINMTSVTIGKGVKSIGVQAFYHCDLLQTVTFASDGELEEIGESAFHSCPRIGWPRPNPNATDMPIDLVFPTSLRRIGRDAFADTHFYKYYSSVVYVGGWVVATRNKEIPSIIVYESTGEPPAVGEPDKRVPTIGIADYAFSGCTSMFSIGIPNTIRHIGRAAFYNCSGLYTFNIPAGVEEIADYTFYGCSVLNTVIIPDTVKTIGNSAFRKCGLSLSVAEGEEYSRIDVDIPDSVTSIGEYAFYMSGLRTLKLSNNLKFLGKRAFYKCESLQRVVIPGSVSGISEYAFYKCLSLNSVIMEDSATESDADVPKVVGKYAFYGCAELKDVTIGKGYTAIGEYAFKNCTALTDLTIGEGTESIEKSAFVDCVSLKNVSLPKTLKSVASQAFRGCEALTSVILKENIETMGMHVFYGCTSLTFYTDMTSLPEGWHLHWNSSFCPIIFGCSLATDDTGNEYVVSFVKGPNSFDNNYLTNAVAAPKRAGYTFVGWAMSPDGPVEFTAEDVVSALDGTVLYAVWLEEADVPLDTESPVQD